MGRKKIKIEPIQGERNRSATFLKRKTGLFKKAHELAILTDSDVAVIVFNRNGKLSEFCSSNMEEFLLRYSDYAGSIERRGPEHFASTDELSTEAEGSTNTPSSWTDASQLSDVIQSARVSQHRRISTDSRSSVDHSPDIMALPASMSMSDQFRTAGSPSDMLIPSNKFLQTSTPLDMPGSSMPCEDTHAPPSSAPEWHQVFHQNARNIQPSVSRMPNGRMVSGMPTSTSPTGTARRWSSAYELELSSQVTPMFSSSLDERRLTTACIPFLPNPTPMDKEQLLQHARTMPSPMEQSPFGSSKHFSVGSSDPVTNSTMPMATFSQMQEMQSRRSSMGVIPSHSQGPSPVSPPLTAPPSINGSQSYPGSMVTPSSPEAVNAFQMKLPIVPGDTGLQNMPSSRVLTNPMSVTMPVYNRGDQVCDTSYNL